MEAIGSKGVSEASLGSAQRKLARLETALNKIENPEFGVCIRCSRPIPKGRMILMPESVTCVACAEIKKGSMGRFDQDQLVFRDYCDTHAQFSRKLRRIISFDFKLIFNDMGL